MRNSIFSTTFGFGGIYLPVPKEPLLRTPDDASGTCRDFASLGYDTLSVRITLSGELRKIAGSEVVWLA